MNLVQNRKMHRLSIACKNKSLDGILKKFFRLMVSEKRYEVIDHVVYYRIDDEGWRDGCFYLRRDVTEN